MKYTKGFWICVYTDVIERVAYMIGYSLILIFATSSVVSGGLGVSEAEGTIIHSLLTGGVYLSPLLGGVLVDRFIGARYTTPIGMIIVGVGYWCGACAKDDTLIYVMIVCVSIGLGLFKNGTIVGKLIKEKGQIDSAFSIRYTLVNFGALIGSLLAGIFYKDIFAYDGVFGFSICFKIAAILMFGGSFFFIYGYKFMEDIGKKPFKELKTDEEMFLEQNKKNQREKISTAEKTRLCAILLAAIFSVVFWIGWYLSYLLVYYYWSWKLEWKVCGYEIPVTWFDSIYSLLCIILGPLVAFFWNKLSNWRKKGDLNLFQKTALGLLILVAGYIYIIILNNVCVCEKGDTFSAIYTIPIAFALAFGEMVFSPLGYAFITKYAPSRFLSTTMSLWGISNFIASVLYGYLYSKLFNPDLNFNYACIIVVSFICIVAVVLLKYNSRFIKMVEK